MIEWIMLGAQVGGSLLQASASTRAAREQAQMAGRAAGVAAGQAVYAGSMERFQIRNQAQYDEMLRRRGFAQAIGSQRAASASAGIIGGRTQQLIEARSQAAFTRELAQARFTEDMAVSSSRFRQESAIQAARAGGASAAMQAQQVSRQAQADLIGSFAKIGQQGYAIWDRGRAID